MAAFIVIIFKQLTVMKISPFILEQYFACYGRSSDCFLVELKDGRKYMLECKNPHKMVEYVNGYLKKNKIPELFSVTLVLISEIVF